MHAKLKKLQRRLRKLEKKKALIRLADRDKIITCGNSKMATDHEKMIAALETDILKPQQHSGDESCKRAMDSSNEDEEQINGSYRELLSKKRKLEAASVPASLYIDTVYLVTNQHKHLGYDMNQKEKLDFSEKPTIHISGVQHLISYILLAKRSMYRPRWCSSSYISSIPQTLLVIMRDVSAIDVTITTPNCWRNLRDICPSHQRIEFVSPLLTESSIMSDLFLIPLNTVEKSRRVENYPTSESDVDPGTPQKSSSDDLVLNLDVENHRDVFPRTSLILSVTELASEGFPLPEHTTRTKRAYQDFVYSKKRYVPVKDRSPIFSVDCEMVKSIHGQHELARICVVNEKLEIVYESLVKPSSRVRDYLTQYSGVSEAMLKNVTTSLENVQKALQDLLPEDAIICGQSVISDLTALKMIHPYIIDTTVAYNLKGMPHSKTSLKKLAYYFLRKEIQLGARGHCPTEDAITAMQLILLKLKIGYHFGNVLTEGCLMQTPRKFFLAQIEAKRLADLKAKQVDAGNAQSKSPQRSATSEVQLLEASKVQRSKEAHLHFNRKHIPQLEVNLLDLLSGHKKTAHYATAQPAVSVDHEQDVIIQCSGNKKVTKSAVKAIKSNQKDLVVSELRLERDLREDHAHVQRRMKRIDHYIEDMYDALPQHSLLLAAVEGSATQPGMLFYNIKTSAKLQADQRNENAEDYDSGDVYQSAYGL